MTWEEREWVSVEQAAALLGCTAKTVYRLIDEGKLPCYRPHRRFQLDLADVRRYIDSTRVSPGSLSHLYGPSKNETSVTADSAR